MYSLPDDSPDWYYGFTAIYAAIGIPLMALTFGFIAAVIILPFTYYDQFNLMYEKVTYKEIIALREYGLDTNSNSRRRKRSTSSDNNNNNTRKLSTSSDNNNDDSDNNDDDLVDESSIPLDQATYCLLMIIRLKIIDSTFLTYLLKRHREYLEKKEI